MLCSHFECIQTQNLCVIAAINWMAMEKKRKEEKSSCGWVIIGRKYN